MHQTKLSGLDLNLLVALHALLQEQHVGRAAAMVGRSQPAMSHSLSRLRDVFEDPLLIQSGRRMVLSPRANALRKPLDAVMEQIGGLLDAPTFDPANSERVFRVMMPDYVAELIMPSVIARMLREAPGVRVEIAEWRGEKTLTPAYLDTIDIVISTWAGRFTGFSQEPLFRDSDRIAAGSGLRVRGLRTNIDVFLGTPHVAVVGPGEREDPVDSWLRGMGYERRIALCVPTYLLALRTVAASELVAVAPKRLIDKLGQSLGVKSVPLPIDAGVDAIHLHTPIAASSDPASLWFRELIMASVTSD